MKDLETLKDGLKLITEGVRKLEASSFSYVIGCMIKAYELAIKLAPFHKGDRVVLVDPPLCTGGWKDAEHFLIAGALGTVCDVEIDDSDLSYAIMFDKESWVDRDGVEHVPEPKDRHTYCLRGFRLAKIGGKQETPNA